MARDMPKEVEKMIAKVQRKKDLTREQALDYMLGVATGRLAALWRYDESLPEGKTTKGILALQGRKKRAEKTAKISILPESADKVAKPAKKVSKTAASEPSKKKPAKKRKSKKIVEPDAQLEISEA